MFESVRTYSPGKASRDRSPLAKVAASIPGPGMYDVRGKIEGPKWGLGTE